jgi:DNA invertase Pin-like site-specific DNA recombinase
MPPQRTPLCDTDGNRRYRGPELSPYQRGQIVGARKAGSSPKEIKDELGHSRGAVRRTLESIHIRNEGYTLPRSGTPLKYTSRACWRIL